MTWVRWGTWSWPMLAYGVVWAFPRSLALVDEDVLSTDLWPGKPAWAAFYLIDGTLAVWASLVDGDSRRTSTTVYDVAILTTVVGAMLRALVVHIELGFAGALGTTNLVLIAAWAVWIGTLRRTTVEAARQTED